MARPDRDRRSARGRGTPVAWAVAAVLIAVPAGPGSKASSFGDTAAVPGERGRVVLDAREAVLRQQVERAGRAARARGLTLYRVLRFAAIERRAAAERTADSDRLGGRAVVLGTAVLERDLAEARAIGAEWERVRGLRGALDSSPAAPAIGVNAVAAPATAERRPPMLVRPVAGGVTAPYGLMRDGATGAWFFRSAVVFGARPDEAVRSPVGGRVVRVAEALSGGHAVVLEAEAIGWTAIVTGLGSLAVATGQTVRPGDNLGRVGPVGPVGRHDARAAAVRLEVWRDRAPVDPAALFIPAVPSRAPVRWQR